MKKRTRKVLLMLCCALALVGISVGATLAYLTDTKSVTNTFTVGDIAIDLFESETDEMGVPKITGPNGQLVVRNDENGKHYDAEGNLYEIYDLTFHTTDSNHYRFLPGHSYTKDPKVTIKEGSEKCYVRALVTVTKRAALDELFAKYSLDIKGVVVPVGIYSGHWEYVGNTVDGDSRIYELRATDAGRGIQYGLIGPDGRYRSDYTGSAIFSDINVPGEFTNDDLAKLEGLEINVVAQAIQMDGFADQDAAWAAFDAQQAGN